MFLKASFQQRTVDEFETLCSASDKVNVINQLKLRNQVS